MLKKIALHMFLSAMIQSAFAVKPSKQNKRNVQDDCEKKVESENDSSFEDKDQSNPKRTKNEKKNNLQKFPSTALPQLAIMTQNFNSHQTNEVLTILPSTSQHSVKSVIKQIHFINEDLNPVSIFHTTKNKTDLPFSLLTHLPSDIKSIIFQYLSLFDQNSLSKTCKRLNNQFNKLGFITLENRNMSDKFLSVLKKRSSLLNYLKLSDITGFNGLSDESIKKELKDVKLERLEVFRISGKNSITFVLELIRILNEGDSCNLTKLKFSRIFEFDKDNIVKKNIFELIKSENLSKLTSLILNKNYCNEIALELADVIQSGRLPKLTHLDISVNHIGDEGFKTLSQNILSGQLLNLTHLDISVNPIGDEGIKAFAKAIISGKMLNLTHLDSHAIYISDNGLKALAQAIISGHIPNLTHLDFHNNKLGDVGINELANAILSGLTPNLSYLDISFNKISDDGFIKIKEILTPTIFSRLKFTRY